MEVLVESASLRGVALIKLFMQLQGRLHGPQNHQSFHRVTKSSVCWVDLCSWRVCQEALRLLKTSVCMVALRAVERSSTIQLPEKRLLGGNKYTVLPLYMVVGTWLNYTVLTHPLRLTSCTSQKEKCNFLFF